MASRHEIVSIDFRANAGKANPAIESLKASAEAANKKITELRANLEKGGTAKQIEDWNKEITALDKKVKTLENAQRTLVKGVGTLNQALDAFNNGSLDQMSAKFQKAAKNAAELQKQTLDPNGEKYNQFLSELEAFTARVDENLKKMKLHTDDLIATIQTGGKVSQSELTQEINGLKELLTLIPKGTAEYKQYDAQLQTILGHVEQLRQQDLKKTAGILNQKDLGQYNEQQIRAAIDATRELQKTVATNSTEYKQYGENIVRAENHLKQYSNETVRANQKEKELDVTMRQRLKNLKTLSADALAETKRYWENMVAGAEKGSAEMAKYEKNLQKVVNQERQRKAASAEQVLGNMKGYGVEQVRQATQDMEKLRDSVVKGSRDWLHWNKMVNEGNAYLEKFDEEAKIARGDAMSLNDALKLSSTAGGKGFQGTATQLQQAEAALQKAAAAAKKGTPEWNKYQEALAKVRVEMQNAGMTSERMQAILDKPVNARNLNELQAAVKRAKAELDLMAGTVGKNSTAYTQLADKTKQAEIQLKALQAQSHGTASAFEKAWSRLKTYVGLYVGAAVAMQKIVATMGDLMELSDKMGEVRKTTGFTADEVGRLSDNLTKLDVRTSLTSLMELSSLAGSVGLKTQQDVQGFTEAANQLLIALPEMGNESARTLIKIAQATGDLKKNNNDVRETLEKVGSTIIALRANSASAAGPITDFVSRVGAVGAQAGISIDQIAALGSTIDALGGRVEMSATALSRMIPAIRNNSYAIANSIGVTESYLKSLSAMDQMVLIFQKLRDSIKGINTETEEGQQQMADNIEAVLGKNAVMAEVMKDLNQQGARAGIVFGLLSQNVDELQKQLGIAGEAYKDNIALQEEFNKMNDTTAAKWARLKNQLEEMFVSDSMQRRLGWIIDRLRDLVDLISMDGPLGSALRYIGTYLAFMKIGWTEAFGKALISVYKWTQSTEASTAATIADTASKEANATATTKQGEASEVAAKKTTMLGKAWGKMSNVMKANVITAAAMALWYLVNALMATIEKARQAEEAISRVKEKTDEERESVDKLFKPLNQANIAEAEKSKLISEINSKYGSYLSKMLTEASNAQEIARAYEAINLQLERKNTLEGMEENKKRVEEGRRKELDKAFGELDRLVMSGAVSQTEGAQLSADITSIIKKGIEDGLSKAEIRTKIGEMLQGKAEGGSIKDRMLVSGQGRADWVETQKTLQGAAMGYYETQLSVQNEIKTANKRLQADMDNIVGNVRKAAEKDIPDLVKGLNSAMSKGTDAKKYTDKESGAVVEAFNAIKAYYDLHREDLTDEQRKKLTDALTTDIKAFRDKYNAAGGGGGTNPYGNFNRVTSPYGEWDADSLVNRRKEMLERVRSLANGADVQAVLSEDAKFISEAVRKNIKTTKDAIEWYNAERLKIQEALHEKHLTNTGDWMDPKKGSKKASKMVQDEMKYYLDELDAYYTERKAMIQQQRNDELISEGEAWRQTLLIEAEWQQRRGELQQLYGKRREKVAKEETAAILDILSERTDETTDYIKKDIENTVKFIEKVGSEKSKAAMDKIYGDIDLDTEKAFLRQRNAIGKQVQFMADTLAKERPFNGITENLQENLTKMGILEGQVPEKMHFLLGQIESAYTLDVKEMVKRISEAGFKEWAEQISGDTQMQQALLAQLRQAYEAVQEGIRKEASRIKKDADMMWKLMLLPDGTNLKQAADDALAQMTQQQESVGRANSLIGAGTASENVVTRLAIKQLQLQLSVQQAQYALMRKMGEEKAQYLDQLAEEYKLAGDLKKAERARIDAANVRKSINLAITEETKKQAELNRQIAKEQEEAQNRLYKALREWADVLSSGLQGVFEASNSGNEEYYNKRAVLEAEGSFLTKSKKTTSTTTSDKGTSTKTTVSTTTPLQDYYIIENAGTSDAKARKESLTELEYLEKQHEIEQHNARMEAWKKLMDDLNAKMNEQITDWINASLQNASIDANTDALSTNTKAILAMTETMGGKSNGSIPGMDLDTSIPTGSGESGTESGMPLPVEDGENAAFEAYKAKMDASAAAKDAILQDQKDIQQGEVKTGKVMAASAQSTFAKMTQAANLYGVAYQAMSNDNLSTEQKFEMIALQAAGNAAMAALTANWSENTGEVEGSLPAILAKCLKINPIWGTVIFAGLTALLGGLMGIAAGKIAKSKSEIASATGTSNSVASGRLVTGMLTYAEGNVNEFTDPDTLTPGRQYNVDAADGRTYRARYMGRNPKTHITNGPEFHLAGERGREAIIDAHTTRQIQMDDSGIWAAIKTLSAGGSIHGYRSRRNGMSAFAEGNISELSEYSDNSGVSGGSGMSAEQILALQSSLDRNSEVLERAVTEGIKSVFNVYGKNGLIDSYDTGKKTVQRYGQRY